MAEYKHKKYYWLKLKEDFFDSDTIEWIEEQENEGEPFEKKMARLTGELADLFACSRELENEIKERLSSIGFDIE